MDAQDGRLLGQLQLAPRRRIVNIMGHWISAWPLAGGVLVDPEGTVYAAAGSTGADGTIVAAVDGATGAVRWRKTYTLDRPAGPFSFGVQANLLLQRDRLLINGGAPVGIVSLSAASGEDPRIVARLEAGSELFVEPDGRPFCSGPEMFTEQATRTTVFKRHQGRAYFSLPDSQLALIRGRLFCASQNEPLDRLVQLMNEDPKTGGKIVNQTILRDVMRLPIDSSILWASDSADIRGLAIGTDGLVVLHQDSAEALSLDGRSLWKVPLPAAPVRWGLALTDRTCVVTLSDGHVICLSDSN
jgi:outer membrane protein assembly factor BamB